MPGEKSFGAKMQSDKKIGAGGGENTAVVHEDTGGGSQEGAMGGRGRLLVGA